MSERRKEDEVMENAQESAERRMGDRRDSHRVPLDIEVREGNRAYESHAGNLSIGGVFFEKPIRIQVGSLVNLRIVLPGVDQAIEAKAEVVEITSVGKPAEAGTRVRFVDLDIKTELLIARYLDDHPA